MAENCTIELTDDAIDPQRQIDRVATHASGATLLFLGTVREMTQGRRTLALDYQAYPEMARREMQRLANEAMSRWPVNRVAMVHRLGHLELGETSVAIAVSSPHRADAFAAGQFLIDTFKQTVPIWKKENWSDGTTEWVHPGLDEHQPAVQAASDATEEAR